MKDPKSSMRSRIAILGVLLTATFSFADEPTTRPDGAGQSPGDARGPNDGRGPGDGRGPRNRPPMFPRMGGRFGGMGGGLRGPADTPPGIVARNDPPTDKEWAEISKFSRENFPNRWGMFERVRDARGENAPLVQRLKLAIAVRVRTLKSAQTDLPDFYETALEQGRLEDNAWGIAQKLQVDPDNSELQAQLHEAVSTLVKNVLAAQAERIKKMRDALESEQDMYDQNTKDIDTLIERRTNRLTAENSAFGRTMDRATQPAATEPTTNPEDVPGVR